MHGGQYRENPCRELTAGDVHASGILCSALGDKVSARKHRQAIVLIRQCLHLMQVQKKYHNLVRYTDRIRAAYFGRSYQPSLVPRPAEQKPAPAPASLGARKEE